MIAKLERAVFDTNILVSGSIFRGSVPRLALVRAFALGEILSSPATRNEFREVMCRPKFDRYLSLERRLQDVEEILEDMTPVVIEHRLTACIDPKDDKFLELAINGKADVVITGDDHLLRLHPFRGIPILNPADYLAR